MLVDIGHISSSFKFFRLPPRVRAREHLELATPGCVGRHRPTPGRSRRDGGGREGSEHGWLAARQFRLAPCGFWQGSRDFLRGFASVFDRGGIHPDRKRYRFSRCVYLVQVFRRDASPRNSVPILAVLLATGLAAGIAAVLAAFFDPPRVRIV